MSSLIPFNTRNSVFDLGGFGNMLDDFFADYRFPSRSLSRDTFKIDIEETEQNYLIYAEMPGIAKESVNLDISDGKLTVSVSQTEEVNEEKKNYIHRERRMSSMSRSVYLADASGDNISARLESGILTVNVPKKVKQSNTTKIEIE